MPFIDKVQVDGVFYDIQSKDTQSFNNLPPSDYVLKKDLFPIGSIYMNINNVNPSTLFGGTWEQIQGRFLLSASEEYSAGSTGGEVEHTLTKNELPKESIKLRITSSQESPSDGLAFARFNYTGYTAASSTASQFIYGGTTDFLGLGQSHNNMPPYLAVYMWKRTA